MRARVASRRSSLATVTSPKSASPGAVDQVRLKRACSPESSVKPVRASTRWPSVSSSSTVCVSLPSPSLSTDTVTLRDWLSVTGEFVPSRLTQNPLS